MTDIDAIVRVVRFPGWQNTTSGEREVQNHYVKHYLNTNYIPTKYCLIELMGISGNIINK
jgi:hypothetical protein